MHNVFMYWIFTFLVKKAFILLVLLIAVVVGYYLISPAFDVVEVDEVSPLVVVGMTEMTAEMKELFDEQMELMKDKVVEMAEDMPTATLLASGTFTPDAHAVMGEALLIEDDTGKILRFENFETINGPNLHIYLATDSTATDFVDLGEIKATKGNVNYVLPSPIDVEKYDTVLVWCVPFKVLFSYAELN
jgi:hypothetical protein